MSSVFGVPPRTKHGKPGSTRALFAFQDVFGVLPDLAVLHLASFRLCTTDSRHCVPKWFSSSWYIFSEGFVLVSDVDPIPRMLVMP